MKRLLTIGDYDNPYLTMAPKYEYEVLQVFKNLVKEGLVYRQLKPVHWSLANKTALAEAELEYEDKYDTVMTYCPSCSVRIEVRIPHSAGKNEFFQLVNVPDRIIEKLGSRKLYCNMCKNTSIIEKESNAIEQTFAVKLDCSQMNPGMETWYEDSIPKSDEE